MIANLEQFKKDRAEAKTIDQIKEFASKYAIRLSGTDEEIYALFHAGPKWEPVDVVTFKPWRVIDWEGNIKGEFRSYKLALDFKTKHDLTNHKIVENKW